jgi:PhnB protein
MAKPNPIPQGVHSVTPNLTIRNCAQAIEFYQRALGATEIARFPAPDGKSVWHAELRIGDSVLYMNDEMPGGPAEAPTKARPAPVSFWLWVPDSDAAFRKAVDAGASQLHPPTDMFWGDRTAMILDPFGYGWTFATHVKDMTPEEMKRAGEEFARKMKMGG